MKYDYSDIAKIYLRNDDEQVPVEVEVNYLTRIFHEGAILLDTNSLPKFDPVVDEMIVGDADNVIECAIEHMVNSNVRVQRRMGCVWKYLPAEQMSTVRAFVVPRYYFGRGKQSGQILKSFRLIVESTEKQIRFFQFIVFRDREKCSYMHNGMLRFQCKMRNACSDMRCRASICVPLKVAKNLSENYFGEIDAYVVNGAHLCNNCEMRGHEMWSITDENRFLPQSLYHTDYEHYELLMAYVGAAYRRRNDLKRNIKYLQNVSDDDDDSEDDVRKSTATKREYKSERNA